MASPALNSSSDTGDPLCVMKGSLSRNGMHFTCNVRNENRTTIYQKVGAKLINIMHARL